MAQPRKKSKSPTAAGSPEQAETGSGVPRGPVQLTPALELVVLFYKEVLWSEELHDTIPPRSITHGPMTFFRHFPNRKTDYGKRFSFIPTGRPDLTMQLNETGLWFSYNYPGMKADTSMDNLFVELVNRQLPLTPGTYNIPWGPRTEQLPGLGFVLNSLIEKVTGPDTLTPHKIRQAIHHAYDRYMREPNLAERLGGTLRLYK